MMNEVDGMKLLFRSNEEKFSFRRVKSYEICIHPGEDALEG